MNRTIFMSGILFGVLAVLIGAFGAHGLEKLVDEDSIQTFETGVKYQMYHALFLLVLASVRQIAAETKKWAFYAIVTGMVLFSFSIYFLATDSLTAFDFKTIGFITPIGGLFLMLGWLLTGFQAWKAFEK